MHLILTTWRTSVALNEKVDVSQLYMMLMPSFFFLFLYIFVISFQKEYSTVGVTEINEKSETEP